MSRSTGYSTPFDHRAAAGDFVDALPVGVDQVHVGQVERRQVVVVEADPLAVLAPVRLELLGGLGILDDLVDPSPDGLHALEVGPLERLDLRLRVRGPLGVDPHQLGPAVMDEVHVRLRTGHRLGEVDDPLLLPPGFEALEPFDVGGLLITDAHGPRGALEDVELLGHTGDLWHHLHGGGTGADDADALVGQTVHRLRGTASGVAVVPAAGVEGLALEVLDPGDSRQLGFVQDTTGRSTPITAWMAFWCSSRCPRTLISVR